MDPGLTHLVINAGQILPTLSLDWPIQLGILQTDWSVDLKWEASASPVTFGQNLSIFRTWPEPLNPHLASNVPETGVVYVVLSPTCLRNSDLDKPCPSAPSCWWTRQPCAETHWSPKTCHIQCLGCGFSQLEVEVWFGMSCLLYECS